jgi:hypothetical protein
MNLQMQRIQAACLELKLPAMATEWSAIADRCASQNASMAEFFEQLLQLELNARMPTHTRDLAQTGRSAYYQALR